jgi:hypothetical protein
MPMRWGRSTSAAKSTAVRQPFTVRMLATMLRACSNRGDARHAAHLGEERGIDGVGLERRRSGIAGGELAVGGAPQQAPGVEDRARATDADRDRHHDEERPGLVAQTSRSTLRQRGLGKTPRRLCMSCCDPAVGQMDGS